MELLGIVQVPLSQLHFLSGNGERFYDVKQRQKLLELFKGTEIDHSNHMNWIDGYINTPDTVTFFNHLGLSQSQLQQRNIHGVYPQIERLNVGYTQGRHRIEAAKGVDPGSYWTVRLYQIDLASLPSSRQVKRRTEQFQHEKPNSDGHIYCKLREYENEAYDFNEWYGRLTKAKQQAFLSINQRPSIAAALDRLISFPGVIDDLLLANFLKIFYLRLDDELLSGLDHVNSQWSRFTFSRRSIQKYADKRTVIALEGRAPEVSLTDRRCINYSFKSGEAFHRVEGSEERCEIEEAIQGTPGLISSLRSLQSNLMFLAIAADVIWEYLIPKWLRKRAKRDQISLRSTLRSCWTETDPYIEVKEGEFLAVAGKARFELSYVQLFLAAFRQFPQLSNWRPKVDSGERPIFAIDPAYVSQYCQRAWLLGFRTATIQENVTELKLPFKIFPVKNFQQESKHNEIQVLRRMDRRWGRPTLCLYKVMQENAFLPTITAVSDVNEMGVIYILHNLLRTLFVVPHFQLDHTRPLISLRPRIHAPLQNREATATLHRAERLQTIIEEAEERDPVGAAMDIDRFSADTYESNVSMRDAENPHQLNHSSPMDTSHSSNDAPGSEAIMHDVESWPPNHSPVDEVEPDNCISTATIEEGSALLRQQEHDATAAIDATCSEIQSLRLDHTFGSRSECTSLLNHSLAPADIEAWRQEIPGDRPVDPQFVQLAERQRCANSPRSRSTIISSPRPGSRGSYFHELTGIRTVTQRKHARQKRRRRRRKNHDSRGSSKSTSSACRFSNSSHTRSTPVDLMPYLQSQSSYSNGESSLQVGDTEHWGRRSDLLSTPRSLSQSSGQIHETKLLGKPVHVRQTGWSGQQNSSLSEEGAERHFSVGNGFTPPRSLLLTNPPGVRSTMESYLRQAPDIPQPQKKQPGSRQRSSRWQGFEDSDDDLVSIDL